MSTINPLKQPKYVLASKLVNLISSACLPDHLPPKLDTGDIASVLSQVKAYL